ncbi:MAG: acyl-CoA dehydrogenase family protein [Anaerolineae bacterium]
MDYLPGRSVFWPSLVVAAKTDPAAGAHGISNFIVPAGAPGLSAGKDEKKMGMKGSPTNQVYFQDCRIPEENLLGQLNEGFKQFMITLDAGRLTLAAMALGLGRAAYEHSLRYAKERHFLTGLSSIFQAYSIQALDMATELKRPGLSPV